MDTNVCSLGGYTNMKGDITKLCLCDESCEPHQHFDWGVECYHDGDNDHGHCPQAPDMGIAK